VAAVAGMAGCSYCYSYTHFAPLFFSTSPSLGKVLKKVAILATTQLLPHNYAGYRGCRCCNRPATNLQPCVHSNLGRGGKLDGFGWQVTHQAPLSEGLGRRFRIWFAGVQSRGAASRPRLVSRTGGGGRSLHTRTCTRGRASQLVRPGLHL
jgi:hypothetical protein